MLLKTPHIHPTQIPSFMANIQSQRHHTEPPQKTEVELAPLWARPSWQLQAVQFARLAELQVLLWVSPQNSVAQHCHRNSSIQTKVAGSLERCRNSSNYQSGIFFRESKRLKYQLDHLKLSKIHKVMVSKCVKSGFVVLSSVVRSGDSDFPSLWASPLSSWRSAQQGVIQSWAPRTDQEGHIRPQAYCMITKVRDMFYIVLPHENSFWKTRLVVLPSRGKQWHVRPPFPTVSSLGTAPFSCESIASRWQVEIIYSTPRLKNMGRSLGISKCPICSWRMNFISYR